MERRTTRLLTFTGSILLFWAVAAPSAHAYIDPGSTNFIIQIVIGALAGAGLAIATFWRRIKMFFSRKKTDDAPSTPAAPPNVVPPAPPAAAPPPPPVVEPGPTPAPENKPNE